MSVKAEPLTPQALWEKCLHVLRENVGTATVTVLFQAVQPLSIKEDVFTIRVPSQFFYEYIEAALFPADCADAPAAFRA